MVGVLSQRPSSVNDPRAKRRMVDYLNQRLGGGSVDDYSCVIRSTFFDVPPVILVIAREGSYDLATSVS